MPPKAKRKAGNGAVAEPNGKKAKPDNVKTEPLEDNQEARLLEFLQASDQAQDGAAIGAALGMDLAGVMMAVQPLINEGKVMLKQETRNGKPAVVFQAADELFQRVARLSNEEKLVYTVIEEAGNKGLWHRELRPKTNLETKAINHIIRRLIQNKFIEPVKSVASSKKKLYILYGLEPDVELTGGPWYAEDGFDAGFVDILRKLAIKHLAEKARREYDTPLMKYQASFASTQEIMDYITSTKITQQKLSALDIERMLDTLVHDRTAAVKSDGARGKMYRLSRMPAPKSALQLIPCGLCKVRRNCAPGAAVSPEGCEYLKQWADF